ncbi:MAG TPA: gephyrin-like molybdotransferase Glp [Candidatus Eremiobacteraceae bacterium]|nr:gephyrin-like molybdotransferase Glp [Candidatus Eremiobacteraceae bacterium]
MLSYEQARQIIIRKIEDRRILRTPENVPIHQALGRVLAQPINAERDYPPFNRSTRDGYAVRAAEANTGATLRCVDEIKAGDNVIKPLASGACIQIMTGAAVPEGADAVVMVELTKRTGELVTFERATEAGQCVVPRGSEARAAAPLLQSGARLGYAELAIAAQVGATQLSCWPKPRVAILSTGDEVISIDSVPTPFQIRNSNSVSLAAQVTLAGGEPVLLGNAADSKNILREKITGGLQADMLVLSGGVSMGKYDFVEAVLQEMGTEFYFDAVAIRPGRPTVFARSADKFVFGLPGNPVSTMVTFELFVVPAMDSLSGSAPRPVPLLKARLTSAVKEKTGLAHFLPAAVAWPKGRAEVTALPWQGSGDIAALAKANCFLVIPEDVGEICAGDRAHILLRKDLM